MKPEKPKKKIIQNETVGNSWEQLGLTCCAANLCCFYICLYTPGLLKYNKTIVILPHNMLDPTVPNCFQLFHFELFFCFWFFLSQFFFEVMQTPTVSDCFPTVSDCSRLFPDCFRLFPKFFRFHWVLIII